jgi:hypothetical protein
MIWRTQLFNSCKWPRFKDNKRNTYLKVSEEMCEAMYVCVVGKCAKVKKGYQHKMLPPGLSKMCLAESRGGRAPAAQK